MSKRKKEGNDLNRIQIRREQDEIAQFQSRERRHHKKLSVPVVLLLLWIGLYFGSIIFGFRYYAVGSGERFSPAQVMKTISTFIKCSYNLFFDAGPTGNIEVSFCQFLAIGLAGAALAGCGAVFQGTFKNVLAGPSTMGVMSGGTMGCLVYLLAFTSSTAVTEIMTADLDAYNSMTFLERYTQQLCVLAGCFCGVLLVLLIATIAGKGKVSSSAMVISGTVFSGVISNIMLVVQYGMIARDPSDPRVEALRDMMMGNFNNTTTMPVIAMMGIPILVCLVLLISVSGKLNVLSFGEDEAAVMGLNVRLYKNLMILIGTILTAMVVSFCGRIGFIGFMVPLVVRRISGPDLKKLLPASIIAGAVFLTVVYDIARLLGLTDYINMITSPVGCAVMVVVLLRKGGGRNAVEQGAGPAGMGMR